MGTLSTEWIYGLIIVFFTFLGCVVALVLKKEDTLSTAKSFAVQIVAWAFASVILLALFVVWHWNHWVLWITGIPAGLMSAKALRLLFQQIDNSKDIFELIENTYKAYKAAKNQGETKP